MVILRNQFLVGVLWIIQILVTQSIFPEWSMSTSYKYPSKHAIRTDPVFGGIGVSEVTNKELYNKTVDPDQVYALHFKEGVYTCTNWSTHLFDDAHKMLSENHTSHAVFTGSLKSLIHSLPDTKEGFEAYKKEINDKFNRSLSKDEIDDFYSTSRSMTNIKCPHWDLPLGVCENSTENTFDRIYHLDSMSLDWIAREDLPPQVRTYGFYPGMFDQS